MTTLLGIAGSLRRGSYNSALLRVVVELAPAPVRIEAASIRGIPLYDGDVETESGIPDAVRALKERIASADGVLLVTPEYNNSIPGPFKNAIDWLSRPPADIPRVFGNRPFALIGATIGQGGTSLAQVAWLPVLQHARNAPVVRPHAARVEREQAVRRDGPLDRREAARANRRVHRRLRRICQPSAAMKAILFDKPGDESVLYLGETADPVARPGRGPAARARMRGQPRRSAPAPGPVSAAAGRLADPRPRVRGRGDRARRRRVGLARRRPRDGPARGRRLRRAGGRARGLAACPCPRTSRGSRPRRCPRSTSPSSSPCSSSARCAAAVRCSCTAAAAGSARRVRSSPSARGRSSSSPRARTRSAGAVSSSAPTSP